MKKIFVVIIMVTTGLFASAQTYSGKRVLSQQEKLNDEYCSGLFKLSEGSILDLTENQTVQGYLNILDWLDGRVAGLRVYTSWGATKIPVIRGSVAKLYVDEIPVDPSYISSLSVNDIAMIKVIKGPSAGILGASGVIAIYTYKDEEEEE